VKYLLDRAQPKASMWTRLNNGDFLVLTVWPGKSDPSADVIVVQIRHPSGDRWETVGRLAAYRTADGKYTKLPERRQQMQESGEPTIEI